MEFINSNSEEQMKKEKQTKQKKKELVSIPFLIGLLIFLILFPVSLVWIALWNNVIPRHQTRFANYEVFREKAENSSLAWEIPDSAEKVMYYWGQDLFVRVAGYGISLSDEAYEQMKRESLERYAAEHVAESEILYVYDESNEKMELQMEWIKKYNIDYVRGLLYENENLEDFYILAYDYTDNDTFSYFTCMLCNDADKRIIEASCNDMYNPGHVEKAFHWKL